MNSTSDSSTDNTVIDKRPLQDRDLRSASDDYAIAEHNDSDLSITSAGSYRYLENGEINSIASSYPNWGGASTASEPAHVDDLSSLSTTLTAATEDLRMLDDEKIEPHRRVAQRGPALSRVSEENDVVWSKADEALRNAKHFADDVAERMSKYIVTDAVSTQAKAEKENELNENIENISAIPPVDEDLPERPDFSKYLNRKRYTHDYYGDDDNKEAQKPSNITVIGSIDVSPITLSKGPDTSEKLKKSVEDSQNTVIPEEEIKEIKPEEITIQKEEKKKISEIPVENAEVLDEVSVPVTNFSSDIEKKESAAVEEEAIANFRKASIATLTSLNDPNDIQTTVFKVDSTDSTSLTEVELPVELSVELTQASAEGSRVNEITLNVFVERRPVGENAEALSLEEPQVLADELTKSAAHELTEEEKKKLIEAQTPQESEPAVIEKPPHQEDTSKTVADSTSTTASAEINAVNEKESTTIDADKAKPEDNKDQLTEIAVEYCKPLTETDNNPIQTAEAHVSGQETLQNNTAEKPVESGKEKIEEIIDPCLETKTYTVNVKDQAKATESNQTASDAHLENKNDSEESTKSIPVTITGTQEFFPNEPAEVPVNIITNKPKETIGSSQNPEVISIPVKIEKIPQKIHEPLQRTDSLGRIIPVLCINEEIVTSPPADYKPLGYSRQLAKKEKAKEKEREVDNKKNKDEDQNIADKQKVNTEVSQEIKDEVSKEFQATTQEPSNPQDEASKNHDQQEKDINVQNDVSVDQKEGTEESKQRIEQPVSNVTDSKTDNTEATKPNEEAIVPNTAEAKSTQPISVPSEANTKIPATDAEVEKSAETEIAVEIFKVTEVPASTVNETTAEKNVEVSVSVDNKIPTEPTAEVTTEITSKAKPEKVEETKTEGTEETPKAEVEIVKNKEVSKEETEIAVEIFRRPETKQDENVNVTTAESKADETKPLVQEELELDAQKPTEQEPSIEVGITKSIQESANESEPKTIYDLINTQNEEPKPEEHKIDLVQLSQLSQKPNEEVQDKTTFTNESRPYEETKPVEQKPIVPEEVVPSIPTKTTELVEEGVISNQEPVKLNQVSSESLLDKPEEKIQEKEVRTENSAPVTLSSINKTSLLEKENLSEENKEGTVAETTSDTPLRLRDVSKECLLDKESKPEEKKEAEVKEATSDAPLKLSDVTKESLLDKTTEVKEEKQLGKEIPTTPEELKISEAPVNDILSKEEPNKPSEFSIPETKPESVTVQQEVSNKVPLKLNQLTSESLLDKQPEGGTKKQEELSGTPEKKSEVTIATKTEETLVTDSVKDVEPKTEEPQTIFAENKVKEAVEVVEPAAETNKVTSENTVETPSVSEGIPPTIGFYEPTESSDQITETKKEEPSLLKMESDEPKWITEEPESKPQGIPPSIGFYEPSESVEQKQDVVEKKTSEFAKEEAKNEWITEEPKTNAPKEGIPPSIGFYEQPEESSNNEPKKEKETEQLAATTEEVTSLTTNQEAEDTKTPAEESKKETEEAPKLETVSVAEVSNDGWITEPAEGSAPSTETPKVETHPEEIKAESSIDGWITEKAQEDTITTPKETKPGEEFKPEENTLNDGWITEPAEPKVKPAEAPESPKISIPEKQWIVKPITVAASDAQPVQEKKEKTPLLIKEESESEPKEEPTKKSLRFEDGSKPEKTPLGKETVLVFHEARAFSPAPEDPASNFNVSQPGPAKIQSNEEAASDSDHKLPMDGSDVDLDEYERRLIANTREALALVDQLCKDSADAAERRRQRQKDYVAQERRELIAEGNDLNVETFKLNPELLSDPRSVLMLPNSRLLIADNDFGLTLLDLTSNDIKRCAKPDDWRDIDHVCYMKQHQQILVIYEQKIEGESGFMKSLVRFDLNLTMLSKCDAPKILLDKPVQSCRICYVDQTDCIYMAVNSPNNSYIFELKETSKGHRWTEVYTMRGKQVADIQVFAVVGPITELLVVESTRRHLILLSIYESTLAERAMLAFCAEPAAICVDDVQNVIVFDRATNLIGVHSRLHFERIRDLLAVGRANCQLSAWGGYMALLNRAVKELRICKY